MSTTLLLRNSQGALVESKGLLASYWTAAWSFETIQAFERLFREVKHRQPSGVVVLMVFRTGEIDARAFAHEPSRALLRSLLEEFNGYFRTTAIVIDGAGFVAAALRSAAWTMTQVLRGANAPRYYDSADTAVAEIAKRFASTGLTRESARAAVDHAMAEAGATKR